VPKKRENESDADNQRTKDEASAENSGDKSTADDLAPYEEKIGERDDNLRRRSDWFQKRSGGR